VLNDLNNASRSKATSVRISLKNIIEVSASHTNSSSLRFEDDPIRVKDLVNPKGIRIYGEFIQSVIGGWPMIEVVLRGARDPSR